MTVLTNHATGQGKRRVFWADRGDWYEAETLGGEPYCPCLAGWYVVKANGDTEGPFATKAEAQAAI